jgi:nicotinamidase-related amidase
MKKILIVVDMQNDFIDGSLGTKEAVAILSNVKNKIDEYRQRGDEVIFTADTHFEDYLSTNEGKHLPVKHCIKGTKGWEISPALNVSNSKVIEKPTFGYTEWKSVIENVDELSIELVGLCTDICVVSNALILKATFPNATIKVDSTCCAGVTPTSHASALTTMQMCQIEIK